MQWAKDLKEAEEYHKSGAHHKKGNKQLQTSIVRQRYNVPIPGISDREFLMHKVRFITREFCWSLQSIIICCAISFMHCIWAMLLSCFVHLLQGQLSNCIEYYFRCIFHRILSHSILILFTCDSRNNSQSCHRK